MRRALVAVMAMLLTGGWVAADGPQISFNGNQVTATGLTPGGQVAWLGVARERVEWTSRVSQWQGADVLADASGEAVLDLRREVPVKSIWVVVDMTSGAFGASSPPTYPWATHAAFPAAGATYGQDRVSLLSLRDDRQELKVLVVRPRVGAWRTTVRHGDPGSRDSNGVRLRASDLIPCGKAPGPLAALVPGDVIVAIDPERMEYFAQQLGPAH